MTGVSTPFTSYVIPPNAPEPVAKAWKELIRIGILYDDARDDLNGAKQALVVAEAEDVKAVAAATTAGKQSDDPQVNTRKAQAEVARLETLLPGYRHAADEAGNRLADTIAEHRDEWHAALDARAAELAATYDGVIAEARLVLAAFVAAKSGANWVSNFDAGLAKTGRYTGFSGGRVRVSGRRAGISELRGEHDPANLLAVAALLTAPAPAPRPEPPSRRQKVSADV